MQSLIVRDPEIMSGSPCVAGTRVLAKNLFDYLEGSSTLEDFLEDFPSVSRDVAVAVLEVAKIRLLEDAPTKSSSFQKRLNMEQSSVAVGASHGHQIQPPLPATFGLGERVRKKSGAAWQGHIVGWYSTKLTPEGYAVESEAHPGSVQIYPVAALERVS